MDSIKILFAILVYVTLAQSSAIQNSDNPAEEDDTIHGTSRARQEKQLFLGSPHLNGFGSQLGLGPLQGLGSPLGAYTAHISNTPKGQIIILLPSSPALSPIVLRNPLKDLYYNPGKPFLSAKFLEFDHKHKHGCEHHDDFYDFGLQHDSIHDEHYEVLDHHGGDHHKPGHHNPHVGHHKPGKPGHYSSNIYRETEENDSADEKKFGLNS